MTRRFVYFLFAAALSAGCGSDPRPTTDASAFAFSDVFVVIDQPLPPSDRGALDAGAFDVPAIGLDANPPCRQSSDCVGHAQGALCHVPSGRCVACLAAADSCPLAEHCDDAVHVCVAGCRSDEGCFAGDGGLADATDGGVGPLHCDLSAHACVACLETLHCPSGTVCVGHACVPGCSDALICTTGRMCCAGGCVDESADPLNCGACDRACAFANAAPNCVAGSCAMGACNAGFGDCDGSAANGCETSVYGNQDHCGACGRACLGGTLCGYDSCAPAYCCADLHVRLPTLPSGAYPLQSGTTPYTAYCDMTTNGGGWTLVLTIGSGANDQFNYEAEGWTDVSIINGDMNDPALDITRRNQGFFQVPVLSEMRFCLDAADHCINESLAESSAQSVFLGPENLRMHPPADFAVWGYTGALGCARAGFNVTVPGAARCRYGVLFDRGITCGPGTDSGLGLGCRAGNGTGISAGQGDGALPLRRTRAWVWVR